MATTPVDDSLGEDSERPSFRTPAWLMEYVRVFQSDYNSLLGEMVSDGEEFERLKLDSQSDTLRRLIDIGLGAYYSRNLTRFAAPPGLNVCASCGVSGAEVRIGIEAGADVSEEDGWLPSDQMCLACGSDSELERPEEDAVEDSTDEDADESVDEASFDGVEDTTV